MKPKLATTIRDYSWRLFVSDGLAGVTVALVALPLSVAIAIASGADPKAGLVTAIIGGLLISLLGGSRVQIGGPTGAFIVVVYSVIQQHGFDGLVLATLMAGVILAIGGFLGAGRFIALVPEPVIEGFTIGIALIIAVSQFKDLFGLSVAHGSADLVEAVPALWAARGSLNIHALEVGLFSIAGIALLRRFAPWLPGSLLVIAAASAAVAAFALPVDTIQSKFGPLAGGFPLPAIPHLSVARITELLPSAFVIAFLAAVESLLSAIVADRMIGGSHRPNAELLAQGAANIVSPLFGGLPATGAIARTATNVRAGGKTPVAGIVHAITILLFVIFASRTRRLSRHAGAGRAAGADGLDHERAGPLGRTAEAADGRPRLAVPDHDPDGGKQPHRCHCRGHRSWARTAAGASRRGACRMDAFRQVKALATVAEDQLRA